MLGDGRHQVRHAVAQRVGLADAVQPGQAAQEVELLRRQAAAGHPGGDGLGLLAVELGLHGVAQAQLDAVEELVAQGGPDLGVAGGADHQVDTEAETAGGDVEYHRVEHLVVGLEGAPAVDDQEDVAPRLVGVGPGGAPLAVGVDGVDVVGPEELLAGVEDAGDLGDRTADLLRVQPGGDSAHMRQALEGEHAAAAEVQAVELHFHRGVGEREAGDHRAHQRRLSGLRTADDQAVTGRAREVQVHDVPALLEGLVDDRDRYHQLAQQRVLGRVRAALRGGGQRGQQLVDGGRLVQRRQPHLVGRRALALHALDDDVEHRVGERVVGLRDLRLVVLRLLDHPHLDRRRRERHRQPVQPAPVLRLPPPPGRYAPETYAALNCTIVSVSYFRMPEPGTLGRW